MHADPSHCYRHKPSRMHDFALFGFGLLVFMAGWLAFTVEEPIEEDEEEEWMPYIPEKPSPMLYGVHAKEEGKVWVSAVSSCKTYTFPPFLMK